jgi:transposase
MIIGVDYHPSDQYIAFADTETGECGERRLHHSDGEAAKFYRELAVRGVSVRVGMEATGYSRWLSRGLSIRLNLSRKEHPLLGIPQSEHSKSFLSSPA